jgi:Insertion element 4 transposase N-terminal/Transposase DDE domain
MAMARTKATLGSGARLSDYLSTSLLAKVFPADRVHEALDAHGCNSQRIRRFPAVAGVYYTMALSLYPEAAYEEVFSVVAQGLAWAGGADQPPPVSKSSISALRTRTGSAPLRDLIRACCLPMANPVRQPQAFYRGLRLMAIDGSRIELADEADVVQAFGRPGSRTGQAGYPQAQCVVLAECATHAIVAAELGPYRGDEWALCQWLLGALEPGMLLLADRGFNGFEHWQQALATGAQLLWRATESRLLPVRQMLADGSYLSVIEPTGQGKRSAAEQALAVRVIEYQLPGVLDSAPRYRLITSLLDPQQAPALELAALYHQRWQVEAVFDELKTHLRQGRRVLRSKTAELVRQEFYGWVLAHYAVRWLLHEGAARSGQADEELSFMRHVHLVRREQPRSGAFPPSSAKTAHPLAS